MDKIHLVVCRAGRLHVVHDHVALALVFTRSTAAEAGLYRNQVTRRIANGTFRRLTRGAFCLASTWESASPEQRHLLLARAARRFRGAVA